MIAKGQLKVYRHPGQLWHTAGEKSCVAQTVTTPSGAGRAQDPPGVHFPHSLFYYGDDRCLQFGRAAPRLRPGQCGPSPMHHGAPSPRVIMSACG